MCCGQKRTALRADRRTAPVPSATNTSPPLPPGQEQQAPWGGLVRKTMILFLK